MISIIQFILFCRINYAPLVQNANSYIQLNNDFSTEQKLTLTQFVDEFLLFIIKQHDVQSDEALQVQMDLFLQMQFHDLSDELMNDFRMIFEQATIRLLFHQKHPKTEQIFLFVSNRMHLFLSQYYCNRKKPSEEPPQDVQALQSFSELLIHSSGPDELPWLIEQIKNLFHFKRCVFYEYIPWSNEFRGLFGENLKTVQSIKGRRSSTLPFFNSSNPIYLKHPQKYIDEWMIQDFKLSSMIFIPVRHSDQLFGWLELDQIGIEFPYNKQQLDTLRVVGERLALMLNRKPASQQSNQDKGLNDKEQTILYIISDGKSNKEIAEILFLSEFTVRDYVQKLLAKLDATNRTHLVKMAYQKGYLS
ncbi:hypothetical protein CSE16_06040 [Solibacillus sp. R5-41]|uniref:response regulator transcription factor n=1 Tax=Solibacillus sp. R5-41 TaxID=2048654 RepID=UPI000C127040|nr:LuxR C-terminal-related transcriptional regulator [Solibacillus sp. R5-41]ATP39646.1 hypothetical protein CSE16_06040 [Solibacillus sp. R5-41]